MKSIMSRESLNEKTIQTDGFESAIYAALLFLALVLPLMFFPRTFNRFDLSKSVLLLSVAVLIVAFFAQKLSLSGRVVWSRTPLDVPVLLFFLVIVASSVFSLNSLESWVGSSFVIRKEPVPLWISYIVIFFAAANFLTDYHKRARLMSLLAMVSLPISVFAIAQSLGLGLFYSDRPAQLQVSSTLGNPIYLGAYLTVVIPVCLGLFMQTRSRGAKVLWAFAGIFSAAALVLTFNRGGWLGAAVGVLVFLGLVVATSASRERRRFLVILIVIILLVPAGLFLVQRVAPRTLSILAPATSRPQLSGTALKRTLILRSTVSLIRDRPLLGWGPETYRDVFALRQDPRLVKLAQDAPLTADRPHNQIFYVAYSFGSLGLFAYFWIVTGLLGLAWRADWPSQKDRFLVIGIIAAATGYLVQEQFSFSAAAVTPLFWLFLGMIVNSGTVRQTTVSLRTPRMVATSLALVSGLAAAALILVFSRAVVADYLYHLGRTSAAEGRLESGLDYYGRAISWNPFESAFRFSFADDSRVLSLETGDVSWAEEAVPVVKEGLQQNAFSFDLHFVLGDLYFASSLLQRNANYSQAREAYIQATKIAPNHSQAFLGIGLTFLEESEYAEAIPYFRKAISITPTLWQAWYGLGLAHEKTGEISLAIGDFEKTLEINPDYGPAQEELRGLIENGQS
jgi:tetratricopeptide (TPR) repeat protein